MNNDINKVKLIYTIDNIKISEEINIKINLCEKRGNRFYDVVFYLKDKEILLGRFDKEENKVCAKYKDGKILIYNNKFNKHTNQMEIIKVLSLYEIVDDTFYSCTEEEALNIFDKSIDASYLKNKNNPIYRSDIEKTRRL